MRRRGRISTPERGPKLPWLLAGLVMVVGIAALVLPPVLSADYHRAAIEALASRLTGRPVTIKGRISLSLVPAPQIIAEDVRIGGARGGRISAPSLRLELAPGALLLGELRPTRITLHAPDIIMPWPLPGGAASVLPPPWLGSLHAKVEDGTIALGGLVLEHADLSIFIGGRQGVLAASGTGQILGASVMARVNIEGANEAGLAPVAASISIPSSQGAAADLSFRGTVSQQSVLTGMLAGSALASAVQALKLGHALPASPVYFTAKTKADRRIVDLTGMKLIAGPARLGGDADINLTTGIPVVTLRGQGIDLSPVLHLLDREQGITMTAKADLTDARLDGFRFKTLNASIETSRKTTDIRSLAASLPGGGGFSLQGKLGKGAFDGQFTLSDPALPSLFKTLAAGPLPALSGFPPITGKLHMTGEVHLEPQGQPIRLARLHGAFGTGPGAAAFTGALVITPRGTGKAQRLRLAASLDFDRLDATPLLRFVETPPLTKTAPVKAEIAITANHARIGSVWTRRFLLDAGIGHGMTVRALNFHAAGALVALQGARGASGALAQAKLLIAGPDAEHVLALLPKSLALPAWLQAGKLLKSPFTAELVASGPPGKLATGAVLHLGPVRIDASPTVNLTTLTAKGPVSLRAPDAGAVLQSFGYKPGLGWPGPGSIGLRADFTAARDHFDLPNFVLSFGALTASGRLIFDGRKRAPLLTGAIDADTLALPSGVTLLDLANAAMGKVVIQLPSIRARRIDVNRAEIAGDALIGLNLTAPAPKRPPVLSLGVTHATVADGVLSGKATLRGADGAAPPALALDFKLDHAKAAALAPAFAAAGAPPLLASGAVTLGADATASGYTAKTWEATLGGRMTASGSDVVIAGVDLASLGKILAETAHQPPLGTAQLRGALLSGTTDFASMVLSGSFANGALTLDPSKLTGNAGSLGLTGSIDIPDRSLTVDVKARPVVPGHQSAPVLTIALAGPWAKPARDVNVAPGLSWMAGH